MPETQNITILSFEQVYEVGTLRERVQALESENAALWAVIESLRKQVEIAQLKEISHRG